MKKKEFEAEVLNKSERCCPKISIITPSYNQGKFIEATIRSINHQDYSNIEHIIVDGASNDDTLDILKKYEGSYDMRFISESDKGQADAINKGFNMASGDIIGWLNSDDIYVSKKAISKIVNLFQEYPEVDVVTASGVLISENGKWEQPLFMKKSKICYKHLRFYDFILQPATFFRKEVIEHELCDISLKYAFDWDLFIRLAKKYNFLPVDEIIAGYRKHGSTKTETGGAERARELLIITKRYLGSLSWQAFIVGFFYVLYRIASLFPWMVRRRVEKFICMLSAVVSKVSVERVTAV